MARKRITNEMLKSTAARVSALTREITGDQITFSVVRRDDTYEIEADRTVLLEGIKDRTTTFMCLHAMVVILDLTAKDV